MAQVEANIVQVEIPTGDENAPPINLLNAVSISKKKPTTGGISRKSISFCGSQATVQTSSRAEMPLKKQIQCLECRCQVNLTKGLQQVRFQL